MSSWHPEGDAWMPTIGLESGIQSLRSAEEDLGTCSEAVAQLTALLGSVLDFSLVRSGRLAMEPGHLELAGCGRECMARAAERAKVPLLAAMQPATGKSVPRVVVTDGSRLQQAVEWALRSAVDFTSEGMVAIAMCVETADGADYAVPWWKETPVVTEEHSGSREGAAAPPVPEPPRPQLALRPPAPRPAQCSSAQLLATLHFLAVVPSKRRRHPVVHAKIKV